jgi:hypothetical protein
MAIDNRDGAFELVLSELLIAELIRALRDTY